MRKQGQGNKRPPWKRKDKRNTNKQWQDNNNDQGEDTQWRLWGFKISKLQEKNTRLWDSRVLESRNLKRNQQRDTLGFWNFEVPKCRSRKQWRLQSFRMVLESRNSEVKQSKRNKRNKMHFRILGTWGSEVQNKRKQDEDKVKEKGPQLRKQNVGVCYVGHNKWRLGWENASTHFQTLNPSST